VTTPIPWTTRARRSLAAHLDRLRGALEGLRDRLHDAVAQAVGDAGAGVLADAVHDVLGDGQGRLPEDDDPERPWSRRAAPLWREPEGRGRADDDRDPWLDDRRDHDESLDPPDEPEAERPRGSRWCLALAVGCQATAWWLRRQTGRPQVLRALAVGLVCGVTAYLGGPLAVAGAALAGSGLRLADLTQHLQAGVRALTGLSTS
jgi:hypothetical protein